MSEQRTLASVAYDTKGKVTRRERFLREMDAVIPWASLLALLQPHHAAQQRARRSLPLETMRRCLPRCARGRQQHLLRETDTIVDQLSAAVNATHGHSSSR